MERTQKAGFSETRERVIFARPVPPTIRQSFFTLRCELAHRLSRQLWHSPVWMVYLFILNFLAVTNFYKWCHSLRGEAVGEKHRLIYGRPGVVCSTLRLDFLTLHKGPIKVCAEDCGCPRRKLEICSANYVILEKHKHLTLGGARTGVRNPMPFAKPKREKGGEGRAMRVG